MARDGPIRIQRVGVARLRAAGLQALEMAIDRRRRAVDQDRRLLPAGSGLGRGQADGRGIEATEVARGGVDRGVGVEGLLEVGVRRGGPVSPAPGEPLAPAVVPPPIVAAAWSFASEIASISASMLTRAAAASRWAFVFVMLAARLGAGPSSWP